MTSKDTKPESTPEPTREESHETDVPKDQSTDQDGGLPLFRREALLSVAGLGGLSALGSSSATAKGAKVWKKDRDANGQKLFDLGMLAMQDNTTGIRDFEGANLGIDNDNVLNADTWDTRVNAQGNDLIQLGGLQTRDNKTKISDFEGANLGIDGNNVLNADLWNKDVDAGGNDLSALGSASASTVNTDTLSDNGSGTINLGALVDADKNELKQLGAVAMQENKTKIVDFAGGNLSIDGSHVLNADQWNKDVNAGGNDLSNLGTASASTVTASEVDTNGLSDNGAGKVTLLSGIDAGGNSLFDIGGLRMRGNSTAVTDFEGTGLSVDGSGVLNVTITDTDTHTLVSDSDGSPDDVEANDIEFGTNLWVTDDGDGSVTVDVSDVSPWEDTDSDNLLEVSEFDGIDVNRVRIYSEENESDGLRMYNNEAYWDVEVDRYDDWKWKFNGSARAYIDDTDGSYYALSDKRLKENIDSVDSMLQDIMGLDVVSFNFIDDDDNEPSIGLIGQDAVENFPELVREEGGDGYLGVNYAGFATIGIKAIQEQQEEIEKLKDAKDTNEERINDLENKVAEKSNRIEDLEAENEQLSERLAAVENRLAHVEISETSPALADD